MADREERRFAEVSRESVKLIAESAGVELGDDVAALLAEDVCYRLREATQVLYEISIVSQCVDVQCKVLTEISNIVLFWTLTEQLPVYETCQEEEADSRGLE